MSLLPSPLAAAIAGTGLACFAIGATRRPDPGLKLTGLAVLAFALAPVPAHADQFVEAADNATIDCELARGELTRIALIDDGFANVSKIASGFPYNDFQVTHEPVRGDIYISVPPQFAAARVSFFATSKAGYVYKFACHLGGEEATQLFITNPALAEAAATEWETETGPEDAAIRLIEAMASDAVLPGFTARAELSAPRRTGGIEVQLVAEYQGDELTGQRFLVRNLGQESLVLGSEREGPAPAQVTATQELDAVTGELRELKARAILYPTPENVTAYIRFQRAQLDRASLFSDVWQRAIWQDPELDYTLERPVGALAKKQWQDARAADRDAVMARLSERYGLFYFFAQTCGACEVMSPIVRSVADRWHITVRAISTDGGPSRHFPDYKVESGQRPRMGLEPGITPALVLWDSVARRPIPIGYGVLSADELQDRIYLLTSKEAGHDY